MGGPRGVVTLLFTDLVGSTELLGQLGEAGADEMRRTHFALLRKAVADTAGDEVKTLGDGLMVAFDSPLDAVQCAIAMQQAIAEHNRRQTSPALGIRVGLHAGEPTRDEGDFFGSAVVVAKRLCDRAEGGQILASEVVAGLVGPGHGLSFLAIGRLRLKGMADPTAAVLVDWDEPTSEGPFRPTPAREPRFFEKAPSRRPTRPPLVGRAPELGHIENALAVVASGVGRMALVVGEMGVGKTRLAEEALGLAKEQGFNVLVGRTGQANSGLAYAPFLAAFGSYLRRLSAVQREPLLDGLGHLARLWPDLGLTPPPPLADPELDRTLLFESVARLLERMTADTPAVVLLDDLHWADAGSLALLSYLTHGLEETPVLLLATYRPEGFAQSRLLRQLVTDALRSGMATEVALVGLGDRDIAAMAQGLLGGDAPADLVAMLHDRTAGTPLFVDALVRGLQNAGVLVQLDDGWQLVAGDETGAVPRGVRDLVIERLDSLSEAERSVVTLIAHDAAGLPHDVLEAAAEVEEGQELLDVIGALVGSGLLVQDTDGIDVGYRLFHPLVQEVAGADLPAVAGRRIHARLALAVERRRPQDLDRIAFHYSRAGPDVDPERAVEVLLQAGERAYSLAAPEQAARHFSTALPFIRRGHHAEQLGDILERLGESWAAVGETAAAIEVWTEGVAEHQRKGDRLRAAGICRLMALAARDGGDVERARRQLDAGVALLADQPASEELVRIHHTRLLIDSPLFEPDRAAGTVEALVVAADTLASPAAKAASLSAEAHLALGRGDFRQARSKVEASLRVAEAAGDLLLMQRAQRDLAWVTWADADISACEAQVEAQLEIDRRLGARAQEPLSQIQFAIFAHFRGEWEHVESMAEAALAQAQRYGQLRALTIGHGTLAWFLADRGELDRSQEQLALAARTIDVNGGDRALHWIRIPEALLALERGDFDRARTAAAQLPLPKGRSILADAHLLAGEQDVARTIGLRLASAGRPRSYAVAMGERTLGLVARADGEVSAAAELLSSSATALAEIGLPFEAAISQFHIGTPEALRAGLATFEQLGAQRWADRARKSLRALGIRVLSPRRRFPTPDGLPLSRRELEVARLVADGLSSAEIAGRLVLSVRTVESHLDHIYARLGISGRAALTRWIATNVGEVP